jgi:hypothetical protein
MQVEEDKIVRKKTKKWEEREKRNGQLNRSNKPGQKNKEESQRLNVVCMLIQC